MGPNTMKMIECEDSMGGIFTAIYRAYEKRYVLEETHLVLANRYNPVLFASYEYSDEDAGKAAKVMRTLQREFGSYVYEKIVDALFSGEEDKADVVFHLIVNALKKGLGEEALSDLTNPYVIRTMELARNVFYEKHHFYGFLRFRELSNGILYGVISPKNQMLYFMMEHFSDRLPMENFLIYDERAKGYAFHLKGKPWIYIDEITGKQLVGSNNISRDEDLYATGFMGNNMTYKDLIILLFKPNPYYP